MTKHNIKVVMFVDNEKYVEAKNFDVPFWLVEQVADAVIAQIEDIDVNAEEELDS